MTSKWPARVAQIVLGGLLAVGSGLVLARHQLKEALVDSGRLDRWAEHFPEDTRGSRFVNHALRIWGDNSYQRIFDIDEMIPDVGKKLSDCRIQEAHKIFEDKLDYDHIRVHKAWIHMPYPYKGRTVGHDIYFNEEDYDKYFVCGDSSDTNLEHEETHVLQHQLYGVKAVYERSDAARMAVNYDLNALYKDDFDKSFDQLYPEQQAVRVASAFDALTKLDQTTSVTSVSGDVSYGKPFGQAQLNYNMICPIQVGLQIKPDCKQDAEIYAEAIEARPKSRPGATLMEVKFGTAFDNLRACHIRQEAGWVKDCNAASAAFATVTGSDEDAIGVSGSSNKFGGGWKINSGKRKLLQPTN